MIDIFLLMGGSILLLCGLWMFSPALAMVAAGSLALAIAYGRYRLAKTPTTPKR